MSGEVPAMTDYIKRSDLFKFADAAEKEFGPNKVLDINGLRYLASVLDAADVVPRKKKKRCPICGARMGGR